MLITAYAQEVITQPSAAVGGPTITDWLAMTALVLAVVTVVLDVVFFWMTLQLHRQLEREQRGLFGEMRVVLAQISERATIVQEQVDNQIGKMIDIIATRTTVEVAQTGGQFSTGLEQKIDKISAALTKRSDVEDIQAELDALKTQVTAFPQQLATNARASMAQAVSASLGPSTVLMNSTAVIAVKQILRHFIERSQPEFSIGDFQEILTTRTILGPADSLAGGVLRANLLSRDNLVAYLLQLGAYGFLSWTMDGSEPKFRITDGGRT